MALCIPRIDISSGIDTPCVLNAVDEACRQWGFFELTGHSIDLASHALLFTAIKQFFALPSHEKQRLSRTAEHYWGFYDRELTKNKRDAKQIFDISANPAELASPAFAQAMKWPAELPQLERTALQWLRIIEPLAQRIIGAICMAMGHPSDALNAAFGQHHASFLRLNYYPEEARRIANESHSDALGIHPHTDAGALTLLAHDGRPGLQVEHNGNWHTVIADRQSLIVNIGDMLRVWSNDEYRAPEHRVLASQTIPRYSAAYFYNPNFDTVCSPLEPDTSLHRFRPVAWQEFRDRRAAGDFADEGEEIQVSWYRRG